MCLFCYPSCVYILITVDVSVLSIIILVCILYIFIPLISHLRQHTRRNIGAFLLVGISATSREFCLLRVDNSSSFSPCHVVMVIRSVHILVSHLLPIISDTYIFPCRKAKLYSTISLVILLLLFTSNFLIIITYCCFPLLMIWLQIVNCLF